ncbi:hypothetical protein SARC_14462, partial [Sphaeroforma arctica JP610]
MNAKILAAAAVCWLTGTVVSAESENIAYLSLKGKTFNVDGMDSDGFTYTGLNKYGIDKYGRSYTEVGSGNGADVDAGGRKMASTSAPTFTSDVDPTESGDWQNYWPSFKA